MDTPETKEPEKKDATATESPDLASLRAELDAIKAERAAAVAAAAEEKRKADEAAAIARGEVESLYKATKAERDAFEAENKEHRKREKERLAKVDAANEAAVKAIPAEMKSLVPPLKGEELAAWLEANKAFLAQGATVNSDPPRTRVTRESTSIPDAIVQEAAAKHIEPAKWWALVKKHQPERAKTLAAPLEN